VESSFDYSGKISNFMGGFITREKIFINGDSNKQYIHKGEYPFNRES
jgi:hypothetical protein